MEVIENDRDQAQRSEVDERQDVERNDSSHDWQQEMIKGDSDKEQIFVKVDDCNNVQQEEVEKIGLCNIDRNDIKNCESSKDSLTNNCANKHQEGFEDYSECKKSNNYRKDNALKGKPDKEQAYSVKEGGKCEEGAKSDWFERQQNEESVSSEKSKSKAVTEKPCDIIKKERENQKECNAKAVKQEISSKNNDINSELSVEQSDENSSKLPDAKDGNTESLHKLHEASQILRNRKQLRYRERIQARHRSSSKDVAKLLRRKRNVFRQQSVGSQDEDQSTHSGVKRKRIPNRPGISFEVGARIEAKDYLDKWYPSKIIAVDEDAAEVLIHFERWSARFDEWMPMESPRIRAIAHPSTRNEQKEKTHKVMPQYKAGEAVLARWTDCKMYPAKVVEVGGNDSYEVLFYDGFHRTVQSINIEKLPKEMTDKVDFPPVVKTESPERRKSNSLLKEPGKPALKKVDKVAKDRTKRDQNDLTSILGKRKRLIVGGIFQAKRNKIRDEKTNLNTKEKFKRGTLTINEPNLELVKSNKDVMETVSPVSPVGYIDGRKIARKEFIIEEDHNHFKCPILSCGKSFRKDKLLQSHMKHYHEDSRTREKKKASMARDSKTTASPSSITVSPAPEKVAEKEESKAEILKTRLKSPVKEEVSRENSKANAQESSKGGKTLKSPKADTKNKTVSSVPETPTDNKANTVRADNRVTRSEKSPRNEQKCPRSETKATRAETRSCKQEGKLAKIDKTEAKITKTENKILKVENKAIKTENKSAKTEGKVIKNENSKVIKSEYKVREEKTEKLKLGQENKMTENTITTQQLPVAEDTQGADSVPNAVATAQAPHIPMENGHVSRSKKRRTTSNNSENNVDISVSADGFTHSISPKEIEIKSEQNQIDVESIQEDAKPNMTDLKTIVQEEEPEEGQNDEIVHCICNCIEETGLMMQCEVCLTWQHGACFDIEDVKEVPDKYVCYACLRPVGLRESFRYRHDLDWFNKGEMTTFSFLDEKPSPNAVSEMLSVHDLVASLHNAMSVLHSLKVKLRYAKEDNHPDLVMWKKPWMDYSYLHCQEIDNNEVLVQRTRADFDHSYFSIKEENVATTNTLNTRGSYDKISANKRDSISRTSQSGETSQSFDRSKVDVSSTKYKVNDKEGVDFNLQGFIKTEKPSIEFDPGECKKNLLDHIIQMQCAIEQQLNVIEEHLQVLESEMGIPSLSDEDLQKQMGKSLCTIRKLMKDLSFVQQLTYFQ